MLEVTMHPFIEHYSRAYLTAIGLDMPMSDHRRGQETLLPSFNIESMLPAPNLASRIFTQLKDRVRDLRKTRVNKELHSMDN